MPETFIEPSGISIKTEIRVAVPASQAWNAVRDTGAVHSRLAPGLVAATGIEEGIRTVTFVDGVLPPVVRERIIAVDDAAMRLVYAAIETRASFHCASLQVIAEADGCRLIWITDIAPAALGDLIRTNTERALKVMKQTLEMTGAAEQPRASDVRHSV